VGHLRSPQADSDLDDIWYYITAKSGSIDIADRLIDSLIDRFELLALHPNLGRKRERDLLSGVRSFPVGKYVIIYRMLDADVLILRVVRGSRDIGALLRH
jgi:toxin ParE1/3/4